MAYLLDADVFIRAKNLHYGLDFCPAFWDWLIAGNAAGKVFSQHFCVGNLDSHGLDEPLETCFLKGVIDEAQA